MKLKTKLALGVVVLFTFLVLIAGLGLFSLYQLESNTESILKNNYESVKYMNRIIDVTDSLSTGSMVMIELDSLIGLQERNVTERGEAALTGRLRENYQRLKIDPLDSLALADLHQSTVNIQRLNMQAVEAKSSTAVAAVQNAYKYLTALATLVVMVALVIIFNLPGYIANPIAQLNAAIQSVSRKSYEERLSVERTDEFGELAETFNQMVEKLDEYEHSNLANLLFEKKRIETIINRMNDPVLGLDQKNKVVFANRQTLELLNLREEQLVNQYAPDVAVENDLLRNMIRQEPEDSHKLITIAIDGKEHFYLRETAGIDYVPTGETEKQPIGRVILLRDVTTFKELDVAKTNFIATISHELKTPIASIQMGSSLLNDGRLGTLNTEQQKIATSLQEESARLSRLVSELLDLSQAESGRMKLNIRPQQVPPLVERAIQSVTMQAQRKNVVIRQEFQNELPPVGVDAEKTTWILTNLLTNAIRHSPENGVVDVRAFAAGVHLRIEVADYGSGIEPRYLDRIFDRFFQIPGAVTGTGLGLTICKEIMQSQHGEIGVSSELGKGSRFFVELAPAAV